MSRRSGAARHGNPHRLEQPGHVLEAQDIRVRVDAAHEGHVEAVQERGDRFVGLDHEHLDNRVGVAGVGRMGIGDPARFIEHQLRLGQIQVEHPLFRPACLDPPGQGFHVSQQLNHRLLGAFRVALRESGPSAHRSAGPSSG